MVRRFVPKEFKSETRLKKILDEQSVLKNLEKRKVRSSLYASDFGQCQRKVWFQFFPEEFSPDFEIDARVARIFDNGNSLHVRLGGYLKRVPEIEFLDEIDIPRDELDVHGRCDGICRIDDRAVVVEFKSINVDEVLHPKVEHVGQLMWYIHMFIKRRRDLAEDFQLELPTTEDEIIHSESLSGRLFESLLPYEKWLLTTQGEIIGEIIMESKQNQRLFHFPVEYDEEKAEAIGKWFEQVAFFVKEKEIPVVKYYPSKFPCCWGEGVTNKCQYFDWCYGEKGRLFKKDETN